MTASERIREEIGALPGVSAGPHRFGGTEYRYGRRELGHVHGDRFADLPLPRAVRDELAFHPVMTIDEVIEQALEPAREGALEA